MEAFRNSGKRRMMGRYRGTEGPTTAKLLNVTGQMPISQILKPPQGQVARARSPQAGDHYCQSIAACRLHPGSPQTPHYTWMDGAMQDLNVLAQCPSYSWTGICGGVASRC